MVLVIGIFKSPIGKIDETVRHRYGKLEICELICLAFLLCKCPGEKGMSTYKIRNISLGLNLFFGFLIIRPISPGGFFTFLVALAHGAPCVNLKGYSAAHI